MLDIQSKITRDIGTKREKNMIKTDSQVYMLELSDTGFKMTVINMFKKIDYQLENFNRCLKAIKLIKWTF